MSRITHAIGRVISMAGAWTGRAPRSGLRILLYHAVGAELSGDNCGTSIEPGLFRAHMRHLAAHRADLEPSPFGRPHASRPQITITFDDGYRDTLRVAAPILAEFDLPFTVFVTTSYIRRAAGPYLDPAGLRELASTPGASVGAHGDTHSPLDALDEKTLRRELCASRSYIEDILGRPVTALSYPYGRADRRVGRAATASGYTLGGCSRYGLNTVDRDPMFLCRTEVTRWDSVADLALKLDGHWDWYRLRHPDPAAS